MRVCFAMFHLCVFRDFCDFVFCCFDVVWFMLCCLCVVAVSLLCFIVGVHFGCGFLLL